MNDPVGTAIKLEEYFDVFSNDIAGFFIHLKPFALEFAVVLVVLEVVLGVMLILGVKSKWTLWSLGLMILFFTFLTFFSAYFNKVTDCGCFGDAIKLTPWESFYKDVILMVMIGGIIWLRSYLPTKSPAWATGLVIGVGILCLALAVTAIRNLPFIDFRAYKVGVNIPVNMQPSAALQYSYVMRKDGTLHTFEKFPADKSYEFVEMNLLNPEALPKISDFSTWNAEGDQSEFIFSGNKVLILSSNLTKMNEGSLEELGVLVRELADSGVEPVLIAASSQEEINAFITAQKWNCKGFQADATVVKTMIRANPGLLLLKEGTVLAKYHYRNTPEARLVLDTYSR